MSRWLLVIVWAAVMIPILLPPPGTPAAREADFKLVPPAQPATAVPTPLSLDDLVAVRLEAPYPSLADMDRQRRCLGQAIYFEARGEPLEGQLAVAQVVLNRVRNTAFPDTICGVVFQNEAWRHRCQFSFACDGRSDHPRDSRAWAVAQAISDIALDGTWQDVTGRSTHYHADYVAPDWRLSMVHTVRHGRHIFYRDARLDQTAANES